MSKLKKKVFCAFEGGGAKGLTHLGVHSFLEEVASIGAGKKDHKSKNYQVIGYAGTSAGSIVATLFACGFKSEEIVNSENGTMEMLNYIKSKEVKHPADLFGKKGRLLLNVLNFRYASKKTKAFVYTIGVIIPSLALYLLYHFYNLMAAGLGGFDAGLLTFFLVFGFGLWANFRVQGFVSLDEFISNFNEMISYKILGNDATPSQDKLTFSEMYDNTDIALRIVATNANLGRPEVFSTFNNRDMPIADAVAASIAIPLVFRPIKMKLNAESDSQLFFDGGLVSNLPAWTFEHESTFGPNLQIVTSSIKKAFEPLPSGNISMLRRLIKIGIFGSQYQHSHGLTNHLDIETSPGAVSLLDFELSFLKAQEVIEAGRQAAEIRFNTEKTEHEFLDIFTKEIISALEKHPNSVRNHSTRTFLLHGMVDSHMSNMVLRFTKTTGFENDCDEGMLIPFVFQSIFERSYRTKQSICGKRVNNNIDQIFGNRSDENRIEKLYRSDRQLVACLCLPSLIGGNAEFVGFDTDIPQSEEFGESILDLAYKKTIGVLQENEI